MEVLDENENEITSGVAYITDGYLEYAQSVIIERALPMLYDGMKPVNRHILYTLVKNKISKPRKSAKVVGDTLTFHPHGDASVYKAMVLMADQNGSMAFPVIAGVGNFGGVDKTDSPAAMRYTEVSLHKNASEYTRCMGGVPMIPNYDDTEMEPSYFPVSFPAVLVNATSGIAVGFSCNIPSFNFIDVCNLVKEFIRDGKCSTVIAPDFVTGGYCVKNDRELRKLMETGKAKLQIRGRYTTDGKKIIVTEVPYGKTIQQLIRQVNDIADNKDKGTKSIRNAYDVDDYDCEGRFTIDCYKKTDIDQAFLELIKYTDFQYSYSANIMVVKDRVPIQIGVWGIIAEWVKWYRKIIKKQLQLDRDAVAANAGHARAFMAICRNEEKKLELLQVIGKYGKPEGIKYIRKNFTRDEVPENEIDFCASQGAPSYYNGGKYKNIAETAEAELKRLDADLNDIDGYISRDMDRLINTYGPQMQRRTEITTKDFKFHETERVKGEPIIDNSPCVYELKDNFLRKLHNASLAVPDVRMTATVSSQLMFIDNRGRILRLNGDDIEYTKGDYGQYIPRMCGLDETGDDYRILYMCPVDGRKLVLLYRDGNIGVLDTSEWVGNTRSVKVLNKGINPASAPYLGAVIDDELKDRLFCMTNNGEIGWVDFDSLPEKGRTARTRAFNLKEGSYLTHYLMLSTDESMDFLSNTMIYYKKMKYLERAEDFTGDSSQFIPMLIH